jgi:hypothetical protein
MTPESRAESTVVKCQPEHLLKVRLVVARVGEMDLARWWNTNGQLGTVGASVLQRGFRRTYHFAQARSVFAVAAHRCREVYDRPGSVTLWNLPADMEDEFELRFEEWLDDAPAWAGFFEQLESCSADLETELIRLRLVTDVEVEQTRKLRRAAELRAVPLPGVFSGSTDDVTALALAFARSEVGSLAVPYQSWDGSS